MKSSKREKSIPLMSAMLLCPLCLATGFCCGGSTLFFLLQIPGFNKHAVPEAVVPDAVHADSDADSFTTTEIDKWYRLHKEREATEGRGLAYFEMAARISNRQHGNSPLKLLDITALLGDCDGSFQAAGISGYVYFFRHPDEPLRRAAVVVLQKVGEHPTVGFTDETMVTDPPWVLRSDIGEP